MPPKRATKKRGKKPPKKQGRPSKRTPEIIERILAGLSRGTPLSILCEPDDMPGITTVWEWQKSDTALSESIARAREAGFDRIAQDALAIADTPVEGIERTDTPDGPRIKRGDMLGHRRLQVETRLKLLAKWDPKRYGDKITQEISGPDGGPVRTEGEFRPSPDDEAMMLRIAETRLKLQQEQADA
ncbi:MAG TPA: hypothetical protein VF258_03000 [Luteolibacter sp.]